MDDFHDPSGSDLSPLEALHAYEQAKFSEHETYARPTRSSSTASSRSYNSHDDIVPLFPKPPTDDIFPILEDGRQESPDAGKVDDNQIPDHRVGWFGKLWTATILSSSLYSTGLSGLWFGLAITGFRYPLGEPGNLSVQGASTLIAAGAKTIELTFILVCVAVIGQELSRRLTSKKCTGITIAEMQLKSFLSQPGSMITNWQALVTVAPSFLGATTILAAIIAVLYTTASDALVAPSPSMKSAMPYSIPATIKTSFGNNEYIQNTCPIQVSDKADPEAYSTCDNIHQTGLAFHNFMTYLGDFHISNHTAQHHNPVSVQVRPSPQAGFSSAASVVGTWYHMHGSNETVVYQNSANRTINNVTMLLPHAGVIKPAQKFSNALTPQDNNGAGALFLEASVVTPAINVLCASMPADDPSLERLVIPNWPASYNDTLNGNFSSIMNASIADVYPNWYDGQAFDSFWGFTANHRPPIFPNLPGPNNTRISWSMATNGTVYLLGRAPDNELFMCSMKLELMHGCSTSYHYTVSGGQLSLNCKDSNPNAYNSTHTPSTQQNFVPSANDWSLSLSLGGSSDIDSSLDRMVTQLWPGQNNTFWNPKKPTIAESLAVLSASMALTGAVDAPFSDVDENGYMLSQPNADSLVRYNPDNGSYIGNQNYEPLHTTFAASVNIADYAAGGTSDSHQPFFVILFGCFLINSTCLLYLLRILTISAWRRARLLRQNGSVALTRTGSYGVSRTGSWGMDIRGRRSRNGTASEEEGGEGTNIKRSGNKSRIHGVIPTWRALPQDLLDPQALFGLALNSRPDDRLASAVLAPLGRDKLGQRWVVNGGRHTVFIVAQDSDRSTGRKWPWSRLRQNKEKV